MIAENAGATNHAGLSMREFFDFCFLIVNGGGIDVIGYEYFCKSVPIVRPASMHANAPGNRRGSVAQGVYRHSPSDH